MPMLHGPQTCKSAKSPELLTLYECVVQLCVHKYLKPNYQSTNLHRGIWSGNRSMYKSLSLSAPSSDTPTWRSFVHPYSHTHALALTQIRHIHVITQSVRICDRRRRRDRRLTCPSVRPSVRPIPFVRPLAVVRCCPLSLVNIPRTTHRVFRTGNIAHSTHKPE